MSKNVQCWLIVGISALLLPGFSYSDEVAEYKVELAAQPVGCELLFKLPLVADTNHGSAFPSDNPPD